MSGVNENSKKIFIENVGYAHNQRYAIAEAGNTEYLERRLIIMGSLSQPNDKFMMFEQVRFETKFFEDSKGINRAIPRLRGRIGANHFLAQHKEHPWFIAPNISYYVELMLKFAPAA